MLCNAENIFIPMRVFYDESVPHVLQLQSDCHPASPLTTILLSDVVAKVPCSIQLCLANHDVAKAVRISRMLNQEKMPVIEEGFCPVRI